ncbi:type II toxin-antitoxin system HicB family antitoxin [Azospirillum canadense]|uniref:type II toxin-antitoxin system HicB family antitoxin n=1 Tax=Azospirillum canadense TaxID=403962 RepID=UPI002227AF00|nr:hypothetical protein [Azospirillum canadense]MCW2237702.1 hypothetical protein [Azospirillum canadense]
MVKYPAIVEEVETGYSITFPDFPEASVACRLQSEIDVLARKCLNTALEFRKEMNLKIPRPSRPARGQMLIDVDIELGCEAAAELAALW